MALLDQIMIPGQIGLTSRPKPRALDSFLLRQRDKEESGVQNAAAAMGAAETGIMPGLDRPNTLAMMLGAGK